MAKHHRFGMTASVSCLLLLLSVVASYGDMKVQLKNGQVINVPVSKEDIAAILFEDKARAGGLMNFALAGNGGKIVAGFTGWGTPRTLVNDGLTGPDDMNPHSTAKDGIAAYSVGPEAFQVAFSGPVLVSRIGIMHKFSGGGGGRDIIERALLTFSDGEIREVRFSKTYAMQYVDVPPHMTTFVRVEPLSFHKGSDSRWGVIEFEALGIAGQ